MKVYVVIVAGLMILFMIGYLTSPLQPQFLGLIVGLSLSFFNQWTTYSKTLIATNTTGEKRYSIFSYALAGFGFAIRISIVLFGVWLALVFPERLDLISVIIGLALMYFIIMADMLLEFGRKR
nr:ATP synthase subunit I [Bacillus suaedae]